MKEARILVVDDEANIRMLLEEILSEEGYRVTTAENAAAARAARSEQDFDLTLLDIWMPDTDGISLLREWSRAGEIGPVVVMSGHGTVDTAIEAIRIGALDFIEKPVSLVKLLRTVETALAQQRDTGARRRLVPPILAPVGKSEVMQVLREQLVRIAGHDAHTLLTGEPGTGREMCARYLASLSERSEHSFVPVKAGGRDDDGAASLLGDEGGPGAFERAGRGVLFINEISDMPAAAQRQLLAVLEQGRYRPSGSASLQDLTTRIVSSAPPGFDRQVNGFRRELLFHLSVVVIRVPPLREYLEDVPELLRCYVDLLVDTEDLPFRRFSVAAQNRLRNYPWPGNIRELRNVVSRLLIMGTGDEISLQEVEAQLTSAAAKGEPLVKLDLLSMPLREAREHFERAYLQQQLMLCDGKVGKLAARVGMERTHLYRKLRSLGVDFRRVAAE